MTNVGELVLNYIIFQYYLLNNKRKALKKFFLGAWCTKENFSYRVLHLNNNLNLKAMNLIIEI